MAETLEAKIKRLKEENPISPHIKDDYEVVGVIPGIIDVRGTKYDLRKITKAQAEHLVSIKCKYLVKKEPAPSTSKKS